MSEQRLIDATELRRIFDVWLSEMNDNDPEDQQTGTAIYDCACQLDDAPTIDPETLPIVRELREKLERVTAERDVALNDVPKNCNTCKNKSNPACEGNRRYHDFGFQENCEFWEWRGPDGDRP